MLPVAPTMSTSTREFVLVRWRYRLPAQPSSRRALSQLTIAGSRWSKNGVAPVSKLAMAAI